MFLENLSKLLVDSSQVVVNEFGHGRYLITRPFSINDLKERLKSIMTVKEQAVVDTLYLTKDQGKKLFLIT